MARYFRLYGKKRGARRTGSRAVGNAAVLAFLALALVSGIALLAWMLWAFIIPEWRVNVVFRPNHCVVLKKRLAEQPVDGKPVYRPEMLIAYQVDHRAYETWAYDITGVFNPDRKAVEAILRRFTIGKKYACWIDPGNPERAVLARGYSWPVWIMLLLPISFITIGGGGLVYQFVYLGKSAERRAALTQRAGELDPFDQTHLAHQEYPSVPNYRTVMDSPGTTLAYRLPPVMSGAWALMGALAVTLATNAMSVLFVYLAVDGHRRGKPDWLLTAFTVPVILCGIATLLYFVRRLLVLGSAGPTIVEISDHPLFPGRRYRLYFSYAGQVRLRSVEIRLVCEERATFLQGTNSRTETRIVYEEKIDDRHDLRTESGSAFEMQCPLCIPPGAMHSFQSDHNEIAWRVVIHGDISCWPDFERAFPLVVCPALEPAT